MNLRIVKAIWQKDMVDSLRNMTIIFVLVFPIAFSLLFQVIMPKTAVVATVAYFDAGSSQIPELLQKAQNVNLLRLSSAEEVQAQVKNDAVGGILFPPGFDQAVRSGGSPGLRVFVDDKKNAGEKAVFRQSLDTALKALANQPVPAKIELEALNSSEAFDLKKYFLGLMVLMSLAMTGVLAMPYLIVEEKEKEKGTIKAILISPASTVDFVAGKVAVGLTYTLGTGFLTLGLNGGFAGSIAFLAATVILSAVMYVEIGLLLGCIFRNTMQVNTWSSFVLLPLFLPAMVPAGSSGSLDFIVKLIPSSFTLDAMQLSSAVTPDLESLAIDIGVIVGICLALFAAVVFTLRRQSI